MQREMEGHEEVQRGVEGCREPWLPLATTFQVGNDRKT